MCTFGGGRAVVLAEVRPPQVDLLLAHRTEVPARDLHRRGTLGGVVGRPEGGARRGGAGICRVVVPDTHRVRFTAKYRCY